MTVDREQIRRDAEAWTRASDFMVESHPSSVQMAAHCLALLEALEQAEQEADQLDNRLDAEQREHRDTALHLHAANAQLATLVEAAKGAIEYARPVDLQAAVVQGGFPDLRAALAAYEH